MSTYTLEKLPMDFVGILASPLGATDLFLDLVDAPGFGLPTDGPYMLRVSPLEDPAPGEDGPEEWILCDVGKSGSRLSWSSTSMRGQENDATTRPAADWDAGSKVEAVLTDAALRRVFMESPGSPTVDYSFQLWGDDLLQINNRTRERRTAAEAGGNANLLDDWLETVAQMGPAGSQSLGTLGGSANFINMNDDNRPCVLEHEVGVPRNGVANMNLGDSFFTRTSGEVLTTDDIGRWIVVIAAKAGSKDLLTRITNVVGNVISTADPCGITVTNTTFLLPKWAGVKWDGQGVANKDQGGGKPDCGGFIFTADPAGYGTEWTRGDQKAVVNWINKGFGASNLSIGWITFDGGGVADYGRKGFGNGTGNGVFLNSVKAIGGNFASGGIGDWDTSDFGSGQASADEFTINCVYGLPGDSNAGHVAFGTGTAVNGDNTYTATGAPFTSSMVGKIIVVYGGSASNRVLVTRVAHFTNNGSIELEDAPTRSVTNGDWFVVGGLGLFVGVGDIMLSGMNVPSGGDFSMVIASSGTVTVSLPFHVGGSQGSPDLLILAVGQADITAYFDNGEHGDFFHDYGDGHGARATTGMVHVLMKDGTSGGIIRVGGRFNHNDALTPSVYLDGGISGTSATSNGVPKGPVRVHHYFTNGFSGNVPSIVRFARGWPSGKGVIVGPDVDAVRVTAVYDDDFSTASAGAKPDFITDDVICSADAGSVGILGLRTKHGNVTLGAAGTQVFAHGLSKTPDHVQVSWGTPGGQANGGNLRWSADATNVTVTSSGGAADNGLKVSITARVIGA